MSSTISCRCGRRVELPAAAGISARCPDCGAVLAGSEATDPTLMPPTAGPAGEATLQPVPVLTGDGETLTSPSEVASLPAAAAVPDAPRIPGYEILGVLGRGGMGVVYRARQTGLKRLVALKMVLGGGLAGGAERDRFKAEAEAVAALQHPNIVQVFEVGEAGGLPYLALEFCPGGSLDSKLNGTPLPPRESAPLLQTLARAMHAAHEKGVIHRDLKPANVLLLQDGTPKVTDFGLARKVEGSSGMTQSGTILGTPSYMAPEQAQGKGKEAGPAADVYALGAVLYEFLTGRPPFKGVSPMDTLVQVLSDEPVPPTRLQPKTPRDLETICLKCLEKDPRRRYASADALAEDLGRFIQGVPIQARPTPAWERAWKWARRRPAVAALSLLTLAVAAVGFVLVSWQWLRAEAEANRARAAQAEAVAAGDREHDQADRERQARKEAEEAGDRERLQADRERQARQEADRARDEARALAADLALERGLEWCRQGDVGAGLLWLAQALHDAPNEELRQSIRANLGAWRPRAHLLQAALEHPDAVSVTAATLSPDGRTVATGCDDGSVRLWDRASGDVRLLPALHAKRVVALAFSPDGARLASGGADQFAQVWDVAAAAPIGKKMIHQGLVFAVVFSPDGATLLTGCRDGSARLWDAASGEPRGAPVSHPGGLRAVAFHPQGKGFVTAGGDGQLQAGGLAVLWDLQGQALPGPPLHQAGLIQVVAFGPGGDLLVTAGVDKKAVLWDLGNGRKAVAEMVHQGAVKRVAFAGDFIVTGTPERLARRWDGRTGKALEPPLDHPGGVTCLALSGDGKLLLTGCYDGARLWETATGGPLGGPMRSGGPVQNVAFGPDRVLLVQSGRRDVRLWTPATPAEPALTLPQDRGEVGAVAVSRDGRRLAVGGHDDAVRVWSPAGRPVAVLRPEKPDATLALAFHPDGNRLAVASRDGTVRVWDVAAGKELLPALRHSVPVRAVAWSPDGRLLAAAAGNGVQLWTDAGRKQGEPLPHPEEVLALAFSPDGRLLTGCRDGKARLWEVPSGSDQPVGEVAAAAAAVTSVAFSPDGRLFLTGSLDTSARLWHTDGLKPALGQGLTLPATARAVAFSPDGRRLLTGSGDGGVRLWDAATGLPIGPPLWHDGVVAALAFCDDGQAILTGCHDRWARLWRLPPPPAVDPAQAPLWAEVLTGLQLGRDRYPHALRGRDWNLLREQLGRPAAP
jgi:WD40 repeat protein